MEPPPRIPSSELSKYVGSVVRVRGRASRTPWQHMMAFAPDTVSEYFDCEDGGQIVVYLPRGAPLDRDSVIELEGTVFTVSGPGKRSRESDPVHTEYSLRVSG